MYVRRILPPLLKEQMTVEVFKIVNVKAIENSNILTKQLRNNIVLINFVLFFISSKPQCNLLNYFLMR